MEVARQRAVVEAGRDVRTVMSAGGWSDYSAIGRL
jgi:hypothetical protein